MPVPTLEVVGRETEHVVIDDFLDEAAQAPAVLLLQGEAGIGKTTLWRGGVERARSRGRTVLAACPAQAESGLAFTALGDLLATTLPTVAEAVPEPQLRALRRALLLEREGRDRADARGVAAGLTSALTALASRDPGLVVAVDDVQWLDRASTAALSYALRRLDVPLGVLLAQRTGEGDALPLGLARGPLHVERLVVAGLPPDDVERMLDRRHGTKPSPTILRRIHEVAGGNPFHALELARTLAGSAPAELAGPLPIPPSLRALVRDRLQALPEAARDVLPAVAALPRPTDARLAAALGAVPDAAVEAAVDAGVLRRDGARLTFTHPLLASAAYATLSAAERRRLHRRLAAVADDHEERGHHTALATDRPSAEAAGLLDDAAARAIARGAVHAAADFYAHARRLTPRDDRPAARRRAASEAAYRRLTGEQAQARAVLREELDAADAGASRAPLLYELARVESWGVDWTLAAELLEQALTEADPADEPLRARIELHLALVHVLLDEDPGAVGRHARAAAAIARAHGEDAIRAEALALEARAAALLGLDTDALVERAMALEPSDATVSPLDRPSDYFVEMWFWRDEFVAAAGALERIAAELADRGEDTSLGWTLGRLALVRCATGELREASREVRRAERLMAAPGQTENAAVALALVAMVAAHAGETQRAREAAAEAISQPLSRPAGRAERLARAAIGLLELSLRDHAAAHEQLAPVVEHARRIGVREPGALRFVPDAVEALAGTGRLDEAARLLDWYEEIAQATGRRSALAAAARCRGLLAAARGDEGAVARLEDAFEKYADLPLPLERARTLLALGVARRRARERRAAREALETAAAELDRIGAALWAAAARSELARVGGRRPADGELTASERRVAQLAAEGLSNREIASALFISGKTVEFHLRNVFRKLGVRSRAQLARRL